MNQILEYSPSKNSGGGGSSGSDNIVRVLAIILIIFAACFITVGGYGVLKKNKTPSEPGRVAPTQAKIEVETTDTTARIKISHDKAIEKVVYNWDSDKETTDKGNGSSEKEIEIQLPAGEHTLNIKVIDINGDETPFKKIITSEAGADIINPTIKLEVIKDSTPYIQITATDETEISYITYKWNNEEETRVDVSDDDKKKIVVNVDLLKGENDLTVVAVDASNRTTTESMTYNGVTKPEVKIVVAENKKSIEVTCTHENGLKTVLFSMNGNEQPVQFTEADPKEIYFAVDSIPSGSVAIRVTAISVDDTKTEATETIVTDIEINQNIGISIQKSTTANEAVISASYSGGIDSMLLNINDEDKAIQLPEGDNTDLGFNIPLVSGNNRITLTVIGKDGSRNTKTEELVGN